MLKVNQQTAQRTHYGMGTVMSHKVFGMYAEESLDAVCRELSLLEELLSRFIPESEVSCINQAAGKHNVHVSPETFDILTRSVELSALCLGNFDVTIAPLVALWAIGKDTFIHPVESDIQRTLALVSYHDIILDSCHQTAGLDKPGQAVDLGGIGKGYAGDCILDTYRSYGVTSAYSNLGGNVITMGTKPDGTPWHIGIQHPRQQESLLGTVSVADQCVVTSGDYQRCSKTTNGNFFHHIINPHTGFPSQSGVISVSIVAENTMTADALSTALFISGISHGLEILKSFPKTEAIFVDADVKVFVTKGLKNNFQPAEGIQFEIANE